MRKFFAQPVRDVMACLEAHVDLIARTDGRKRTVVLIVAAVITWFVYVPIHELLHALGCTMWGGIVTRLEISAMYGAALLKPIFPFVVSGSDYAGQLTGFDTRGSDFIYFSTCFLPFVLTILFGVPILRMNVRKPTAIRLGVGVVVGLAPFYNLPGDYYEMGSIIVTHAISVATGQETIAFQKLRSDDIFKLLGIVFSKPQDVNLNGGGELVKGYAVIAVSFVTAVLLAFLTYWVGHILASLVIKPTPPSVAGGGSPAA